MPRWLEADAVPGQMARHESWQAGIRDPEIRAHAEFRKKFGSHDGVAEAQALPSSLARRQNAAARDPPGRPLRNRYGAAMCHAPFSLPSPSTSPGALSFFQV